jgi:hypothetical protein
LAELSEKQSGCGCYLDAISKVEGAFESGYFTGLIFDDSGRFRPVLGDFVNFRDPFFLFSLFFIFDDGILERRNPP